VLTLPPPTVLAAFAALAVAMAALWAPRLFTAPSAMSWWIFPFAAALLLAQASGVVDTRGLIAIFVFTTACRFGAQAGDGAARGFALAVMLALSAGFLLHVVPGFANPRVLDGVALSADALPYTKYLNFDKGVAGLVLLGLFAPDRVLWRAPPGTLAASAWRFAVVVGVVMALTMAAGYARWEPKLPAWSSLWLASMVFLTALPEEALFRHVIQGSLHAWLGESSRARWTATLSAAALFGLAHASGGWIYVGLATVAGVGYGLVYALTRSLAAAIVAHTALNLLHLLFFSYPALQTIRTITPPE
jgi:membrane protease YdiL (CAAX protease family)